eukprot:CAMPEP_0178426490 /NCGR_PEP_ID=MMETSP0689_2-20121128/29261_1 /TAXON_ID=160604 /ORGANISM="Amphidinium massartii, Strain CS-259" /LENGTH=192 /DNA_ID=CAMNT_0020048177 /DNA_START=95 /DNA_END=673 /DNA_ORIENTATION=+
MATLEAWRIPDAVEDQKAENRLEPNEPVDVSELGKLGIMHWQLNPSAFQYPVKAVPYDASETGEKALEEIRSDRGYNYADVITVHPDHLPEFETKVKAFFEEHIHSDEEVRYILGGSGYFDVRDQKDKWVRIHIKQGDLITLPAGIYHRFTCDKSDYIHAMRLFKGTPVWTPLNRPQEDHPARKDFLASLAA